jgi:hypothetical protein
MGTSNFYSRMTSKVFALIPPDNEIDEETGEEIEDSNDWWYYYTKEDIIEQFKEASTDFEPDGKTYEDGLRSFPGVILGTIRTCKRFELVDAEMKVDIILRSGYYEGCNLDYSDIEYDVSGGNFNYDTVPDIKDLRDDMESYLYIPEEESESIATDVKKYFEEERDRIVTLIEDVFERCSTPLNVVAQFSNGETIYAKANN